MSWLTWVGTGFLVVLLSSAALSARRLLDMQLREFFASILVPALLAGVLVLGNYLLTRTFADVYWELSDPVVVQDKFINTLTVRNDSSYPIERIEVSFLVSAPKSGTLSLPGSQGTDWRRDADAMVWTSPFVRLGADSTYAREVRVTGLAITDLGPGRQLSIGVVGLVEEAGRIAPHSVSVWRSGGRRIPDVTSRPTLQRVSGRGWPAVILGMMVLVWYAIIVSTYLKAHVRRVDELKEASTTLQNQVELIRREATVLSGTAELVIEGVKTRKPAEAEGEDQAQAHEPGSGTEAG